MLVLFVRSRVCAGWCAQASKTPAGTTSLVPNLSTSGMRAGTGVDSGANSDASESGSESSSNEDEGSDSHKLEG